MDLKRIVRNIALGQSTKGECMQCGHTDRAGAGCACPAPYCPCHRGFYGHGAWGCDDRHQWGDGAF